MLLNFVLVGAMLLSNPIFEEVSEPIEYVATSNDNYNEISVIIDVVDAIEDRFQKRNEFKMEAIALDGDIKTNNEIEDLILKQLVEEGLVKSKEQIEEEKILKELEEQRLRKIEEIEEKKNNSFNSNNIYSFDLRKNYKLSLEEIKELTEYKFSNLKGIANYIYKNQDIYDVNTYFIIAVIRHESGNGSSRLARQQNNLIGARVNGDWLYFDSKGDCVNYVYNLLGNKYLKSDGKFFNGYTISGVNTLYCEGNSWTYKIANIMISMKNEID